MGIDLSEASTLEEINNKLSNFDDSKIIVESIYSSRTSKAAKSKSVYSLATNREIGEVTFDSSDDIEAAFSSYKLSEWGSTCVTERADILNNIASSLEDDPYEILYYLIHEAGKHIEDAVDEVREAVDFLRYYAKQAVGLQKEDHILEGPTGEINALSYSPKGHILCISPWNFPLAIFTGQITLRQRRIGQQANAFAVENFRAT